MYTYNFEEIRVKKISNRRSQIWTTNLFNRLGDDDVKITQWLLILNSSLSSQYQVSEKLNCVVVELKRRLL